MLSPNALGIGMTCNMIIILHISNIFDDKGTVTVVGGGNMGGRVVVRELLWPRGVKGTQFLLNPVKNAQMWSSLAPRYPLNLQYYEMK